MTLIISMKVYKISNILIESQKYEIGPKYGIRITHENKTGKIIGDKMSKVFVLFSQRKVVNFILC